MLCNDRREIEHKAPIYNKIAAQYKAVLREEGLSCFELHESADTGQDTGNNWTCAGSWKRGLCGITSTNTEFRGAILAADLCSWEKTTGSDLEAIYFCSDAPTRLRVVIDQISMTEDAEAYLLRKVIPRQVPHLRIWKLIAFSFKPKCSFSC